MPKHKVYSDEAILTAMQTHATVEGAANAVGCSKRLIYERMQDEGFRQRLSAFRSERVRAAAAVLDNATMAATRCLVEIVQDTEANPSDRIRAATAILEASPKYEERLAGLESRVFNAQHKEAPIFQISYLDVWKGMSDTLEDEE